MTEVIVGSVASFPETGRMVVEVNDVEVGIFRRGDGFVAWENICPHMGGPVCQGKMMPRVEEIFGGDQTSKGFRFSKDRKNVVCPWHGYEFDIETGVHHGHSRMRLRRVLLQICDGSIVVTLDAQAMKRIEFGADHGNEGHQPR